MFSLDIYKGGVGSKGEWVREWRRSIFGVGP